MLDVNVNYAQVDLGSWVSYLLVGLHVPKTMQSIAFYTNRFLLGSAWYRLRPPFFLMDITSG